MKKLAAIILILFIISGAKLGYSQSIPAISTDLKVFDVDTGKDVKQRTKKMGLIINAKYNATPGSLGDNAINPEILLNVARIIVTDLLGNDIAVTEIHRNTNFHLNDPIILLHGEHSHYMGTYQLPNLPNNVTGLIINVELGNGAAFFYGASEVVQFGPQN